MKELGSLMAYEYKKILKRTSSWLALSAVLGLTLFGGVGTLFGSVYVEGEKVDTHYNMMKKERNALEELEGQKMDESFFKKIKEKAEEVYSVESNADSQGVGITPEQWKENCEFYLPYARVDELCGKLGTIEETEFYEARNRLLEETYQEEMLSDKEIKAHMAENQKVGTPFTYGNMLGFERYFALQYTTGIFLALAVAICLAPMFAGEYTANMDVLVLSSRYGKNKVIWAKLLTGFSFAALSAIVTFGIQLLEIGTLYGFSGWNLPVQVSSNGFYLSLPVTMLGMLGISLGCGILAVSMTAGFVMFCSAKMKTPFGVIILSFIFIVAPVFLIYAATGYRYLYMLVNSLPTSMMSSWAVAADQLFSIGGRCFYFFQVIPVVYLCLMAGLSVFSYRSFKSHQPG